MDELVEKETLQPSKWKEPSYLKGILLGLGTIFAMSFFLILFTAGDDSIGILIFGIFAFPTAALLSPLFAVQENLWIGIFVSVVIAVATVQIIKRPFAKFQTYFGVATVLLWTVLGFHCFVTYYST